MCCFGILRSVEWYSLLPTFWDNLSFPTSRVQQSLEEGADGLTRNVGKELRTPLRCAKTENGTYPRANFASSILLYISRKYEIISMMTILTHSVFGTLRYN